MKALTIIILTLLHLSFLNAQPTRQGKDFALFFAVSEYDEWGDLQTPVENAEDIAKELRERYGFGTEVVKNPSMQQIYAKLDEYRRKRFVSDGQLLIFFGGHGHRDQYGTGFFVPRDGKKSGLDPFGNSYISYSRLREIVNALPAPHILFAMDACYSGILISPFNRNRNEFGKRPGETEDMARQRFIDEGLESRTRLVLTSGGDQRTPDPSEFAEGFLNALREGGRSFGVLNFDDLWSNYLQYRTPKPQKGKFDSHNSGDFLFIQKKQPIPPPDINPQLYRLARQEADGKFSRGDYNGAILSYKRALRYATTAQRRDCEGRIAAAQQAMANAENDRGYEEAMAQGNKQLGAGDCQEAKQSYRRALTYRGNDAAALRKVMEADDCLEKKKIVPAVNASFSVNVAGLSLAMRGIGGGTFTMGSRDSEAESDETPHTVTLGNFAMGQYEVTNQEYCAFLNEKGNQREGGREWIDLSGSHRSEKCRIYKRGGVYRVKSGYGRHPVIYVTWYGARAYANWLARKTGQPWRLPTEAEWEYAAKGGQSYKYAGSNSVGEVAWYTSNTNDSGTRRVGKLKPNGFGLYDMSGNVREWCSDWYGDYGSDSKTNPKGPSSGSRRVLRGGSWSYYAKSCRVANRDSNSPDFRFFNFGFRVCRSL